MTYLFNEPDLDLDKLMEDIDLEKFLKEFINHRGRHKKIKKFKQRVFTTFIYKCDICQGALNSAEIASRMLKIYVQSGLIVKKEVKTIRSMPAYEYKINLPN